MEAQILDGNPEELSRPVTKTRCVHPRNSCSIPDKGTNVPLLKDFLTENRAHRVSYPRYTKGLFSRRSIGQGVKLTVHLHQLSRLPVKSSRNRPGVVQRVPGGLGSQIFMTFGHMKVMRSSASRTGRLYPQENSWYLFSLGAESTPGPWCGRKEICH